MFKERALNFLVFLVNFCFPFTFGASFTSQTQNGEINRPSLLCLHSLSFQILLMDIIEVLEKRNESNPAPKEKSSAIHPFWL